VDRACVLAIADFSNNPARDGMQTQMDSFVLALTGRD